jgi:hypothetical protein
MKTGTDIDFYSVFNFRLCCKSAVMIETCQERNNSIGLQFLVISGNKRIAAIIVVDGALWILILSFRTK